MRVIKIVEVISHHWSYDPHFLPGTSTHLQDWQTGDAVGRKDVCGNGQPTEIEVQVDPWPNGWKSWGTPENERLDTQNDGMVKVDFFLNMTIFGIYVNFQRYSFIYLPAENVKLDTTLQKTNISPIPVGNELESMIVLFLPVWWGIWICSLEGTQK